MTWRNSRPLGKLRESVRPMPSPQEVSLPTHAENGATTQPGMC